MDRNLLTNSDLSAGNNLDEEFVTNDDDDDFWTDDDDDDDNEDDESCDDDDDWWDPRKTYTGWDYIAHFGEDSWDKLNFIKPSWLVIVIFFLDYLPGVFLIYLSMKEMDCLTHFLDLGNLE